MFDLVEGLIRTYIGSKKFYFRKNKLSREMSSNSFAL